MNQKENVASALGSILLGILLIVMKGKIITAAITLLAVFVIVGAIMDFVAGLVNYGIVKSQLPESVFWYLAGYLQVLHSIFWQQESF